jgi:hypothetical protein
MAKTIRTAWWFNPRTGQAEKLADFDRGQTPDFDPPGDPARGSDWLLIIDNPDKKFPPPGTV